jgi:hypothetical protein
VTGTRNGIVVGGSCMPRRQVVADLGTTLTGIQTAITLYTLVMASLMITCPAAVKERRRPRGDWSQHWRRQARTGVPRPGPASSCRCPAGGAASPCGRYRNPSTPASGTDEP